jgi:hypothetical protein
MFYLCQVCFNLLFNFPPIFHVKFHAQLFALGNSYIQLYTLDLGLVTNMKLLFQLQKVYDLINIFIRNPIRTFGLDK